MKNLNQIEPYKLSEKYTIYKLKYNGIFSKEDFLKRVFQNKSLYAVEKTKRDNSLLIYIDCNEFQNLENFVCDTISSYFNINTSYKAKSSWIYTQNQDFNMNWMHTHEYLHSSNNTNLKTEYTFVFYIQIPNDIKNGEGDIVFKTEDNILHRFTPTEFDIFIFSGDLPHMAIPTQNSKTERIVYASNLSFDFTKKVNTKNNRIRFKNVIYKKLFGHNRDLGIK